MSKAAKGSLATAGLGDGLGRAAGWSALELMGLPRLMGVMSGKVGFSSTTGAWYAPTTGGEAIFVGGVGSC